MKTEANMVKILRNFFGSLGYVTIQEFGVGYGKADLVAFSLALDNCEKRIANRQKKPLERLGYFQLLAALPDVESGKIISLEDLSNDLPFSMTRIKYYWLKALQELGYVGQVGKHCYAKINGFTPITKEIVAVEAKLNEWKRGAIQAKRYTVFANRTYLAVHNQIAHRVDRDLLSKHGIGLLLVSAGGVQEALSAPEVGPIDKLRHQLAGEAAWKLYYRKKGNNQERQNASGDNFSPAHLHS